MNDAERRVIRPGTSGGVPWAVLGVATALETLLLLVIAARRGINADEGFYLAAGRYVWEGRRLYADVFFPQMPYLPYAEAAVFGATGVSLFAVRALCAVAGGLGAGLLAYLVWRQEGSSAAAAVAALLYAASGVLLTSLTIVKTYALANLLLLIALAAVTRSGGLAPFTAGIAAALALGLRLVVAPVCLVLAALAWRDGRRALLAFVVGGVVGSLPWLLLAATHPDHFWFCNMTFHSLRREVTEPAAILWQKVGVLAKWILVPQHAILWCLALAGVVLAPRRVLPPLACALVLAVAYAMATPTYLEYTAQFLPFLLLAGAPALAAVAQRRKALAVGLAIYVIAVYPFVRSVPASDELAAKRALWNRDTVGEVVSILRRETAAGEPVLSWWEGYPVISDRPGFVGVGFWESNVAKKIDAAAAKRYHLLQRDDLRQLIAERQPAAIVAPDDEWQHFRGDIAAAGYDGSHRVGAVTVYLRTGSR